MAPLVVSIPHTLGRAEARRRLESGLQGLLGGGMLAVEQQAWSGDRMTFAVRVLGQLAPGRLDVLDDAVRLEIDLPGILKKVWAPIQSALLGRARLLLEKR